MGNLYPEDLGGFLKAGAGTSSRLNMRMNLHEVHLDKLQILFL